MHSHRVDPKKYMQSLQADIPLIDHFPTSGQTSIQYPPFNLRKNLQGTFYFGVCREWFF